MTAVLSEIDRRAFITGDAQTLALLDLMEQTAEEQEEAAADALAEAKSLLVGVLERVDGLASSLRAARPLKKAQMLALAELLDRLAVEPPEGLRAGIAFDAEIRRACGVRSAP